MWIEFVAFYLSSASGIMNLRQKKREYGWKVFIFLKTSCKFLRYSNSVHAVDHQSVWVVCVWNFVVDLMWTKIDFDEWTFRRNAFLVWITGIVRPSGITRIVQVFRSRWNETAPVWRKIRSLFSLILLFFFCCHSYE